VKSKAILIPLVLCLLIAGAWLFGTRSAVAQVQTVFICNGVVQGSPNCEPPTPVLKNYIRVDRSFGALAYDEAKAIWYGSYRYPSKSSAQKGVIENCEANGGTACKLMLSYTNQCAAVARAVDHGVAIKGKDTVNTGSTQEEAEANATRSCVSDWGVKGCAVALSNCSHHSVARWSRWVYE
jgi:hypothetical protein